MKFIHLLPLLVGLSLGEDSTNSTIVSPPLGGFTSASQTSESLKVKLRDVTALTFQAGKFATRSRTTPVEQIKCISGCTKITPNTIRCDNTGFDGRKVQWTCKAPGLPKGTTLDNTRVLCEGFSGSDDFEYITQGSCRVEFVLNTQAVDGGNHRSNRRPVYNSTPSGHKGPLSYIIPIVIIAIAVVLVVLLFRACSRRNQSSGVVLGPPAGQPIGQPQGFQGGPAAYPSQPGYNPNMYQGGGAPPMYPQPGYAQPMMAPASGGGGGSNLGAGLGGFAAGAATGGVLGYMMGGNRGGSHYHDGYNGGGGYGAYGGGGGGGDYNAGDMGGGGGFETVETFADTGIE